ncbi:arylamine N-acetyltransferase [Paenibacillus sp. GSMTC-2017]|uniref:arylamine N-acetyltransferase family protein n=1 Tax=Paenibacillus sp. GSMTC-2017 TaxID=2794350 RepID=UPI0018D789C4|nr:arylamine N-acetyltransferase [Paenibacillus sp. GSMTC-2017]MBH5318351.1 arylamine N-acetyltransferase [Paenibacillus sp. GSMTC-2017]
MNELNNLFRQRIGFPEHITITFDQLTKVLERTALSLPFENLRVIAGERENVTRDYLLNKIVVNKEGGLCYELNAILYLFLLENGFDVRLTRGIVFNHGAGTYFTLGKTHVVILLNHEGITYLVDTGFGGNLALSPLPLTGEIIISSNGGFSVKPASDGPGDYTFELKLHHKDTEWRIGYTFDSKATFTDLDECNDAQSIVIEHPESTFNKHPLVTKLTERGNVTLTDRTFTQWVEGKVTKEEIDAVRFKELLRLHFGM